jgi:hypothetical protein
MSTKTNFKRIALVAVAALGMGVLSSVPSQAVGNSDSLTVTTGTQYTTAAGGSIIADSGTAATAAFQFLASSSYDTYTLIASLKSGPADNTRLPMFVVDTVSMAGVTAATSRVVSVGVDTVKNKNDTITANTSILIANAAASSAATTGIVYAKFKVMMAEPTIAGTYVVNIKSTPSDTSSSDNVPDAGVDVTITVSGATTAADPGYSKAQMNSGSSWSSLISLADSSVAVAMTASTTPRAVIRVALADSTGVATYTNESVTITTTVGTVGTATTAGSIGRSVKFDYANSGAGYKDFGIFADGTAGTATITISTPSVTFATKTVTFYSTTSSKIVATKALNTLSVGSNSNAVLGKATDANGNTVGADATSTGVYAYSSNTAVVSDSGTACTYDSTYQIHKCALTGVAAGTAKITLRNSSTAGTASTVNSAETIEVTVNANAAATLKMEFSKTTYAPGEKGYLIISALDSAGKAVGPQALSALINAAGISRSGSFSGTEPTWTTTSYTLAANNALLGASFTTAEAASVSTVYMPYSGGTVSVSATAGTSLPAAAQATKVTATATVTDSGAAALAAVTALATTVASLRTLITTLTNLVLKIQKKVKA